MELSFGQVETTLASHFRVHPDKIGTFRARIKQLQRLGFPPGVNVGRGLKMSYSAAHLYQLVTAFELINFGFPAAPATALVQQRWANFAAGYSLALELGRTNWKQRVYLRVLNCALADLQGERTADADLPNVFVEDADSLNRILESNGRRLAHTYAVICATDLSQSVNQALERSAQVHMPHLDPEPKDWKVETSEENWWMMAQGGWERPWNGF